MGDPVSCVWSPAASLGSRFCADSRGSVGWWGRLCGVEVACRVCSPGSSALSGSVVTVVTAFGGGNMLGVRQVNLRLPESLLADVDAAAWSGGRNAWLVAAVREKLVRDGDVLPVPLPLAPVSVGSVSQRAPRGTRVVGVSAAARELL